MALLIPLAVLCVSIAVVVRRTVREDNRAMEEDGFLREPRRKAAPASPLLAAVEQATVAVSVAPAGLRRRSAEWQVERRRRRVVRGRAAHVRWWERLRAAFFLVILVCALGALVAVAVGGAIMLSGLLLERLVG